MPCCQTKHDAIDLLPPMPEAQLVGDLEAVLGDRLASLTLLRFAAGEHSSENVEFLLEVHELNMLMSLKARMRRMLTSRSSARGSETRRSTEGGAGAGAFHRNKVIDMTRSIITKHVANHNLCLTENIGGALRKWLRDQDQAPSVPSDLITKAYNMTLKTVKHDIFPRFRSSSMARELLYVHLARTLQHEGLRSDFAKTFSTAQQHAALNVWVQLADFSEPRFPTARSKWEAVADLLERHEEFLKEFCQEEHVRIKLAIKASDKNGKGPDPDLFDGAKAAMQNLLADAYVSFVSSEKLSKRHLAELGVRESTMLTETPALIEGDQPMASGMESCETSNMDYTDGW